MVRLASLGRCEYGWCRVDTRQKDVGTPQPQGICAERCVRRAVIGPGRPAQSTLPASKDVGRDFASVPAEDLDHRAAEPDIHLPPGKRVGNAVEAAVRCLSHWNDEVKVGAAPRGMIR